MIWNKLTEKILPAKMGGIFLWKTVVTLRQAWTLGPLSAQIKTPLHKFAEA